MLSNIKNFLFKNQTAEQTIAKNTVWLFLGQGISRFFRAGIVIYAARLLPVESWGAFSYALGIATFLTVFSDMGLNALITKTASRDPQLRSRYIATALVIKISLVIALSIGTIILFPFFAKIEEARALMPILIFLFAFDTIRDLGSAIARSLEKMQIEAGVQIFTNAAIAIFGFIALFITPSSISLAFGYASGTGFGMLLLLYTFRNEFKNLWVHFDSRLIRTILVTAWPFGLLGLMGVVMLNTDIIMLGSMRSAEEVGYYAAAQKLIQILYMLPTFLAISTFPSFARTFTTNSQEGARILWKSVRLVVSIAIPMAIFGTLFAKPIILSLFGASYIPAISTFTILITTVLIVFPSSLISNAIFAYNAEKSFIYLVLIALFGNIFFNLLLIPHFGIEGAALSTLFTQIIVNALMWKKIYSLMQSLQISST